MRQLRVANIIEEGKLGGPQLRMINVAAAIKCKVDTTIIMPIENSEYFQRKCEEANIQFETISISRITREWRAALRYIFFSVFETFKIAIYLKKGKFDLIHVSGGSWQYKGVIAGKLAGIKVLWHLNDTSMPKLFQFIFSIFSPLADGYIFASNRSKDYYKNLIWRDAKQCVIPAPVNTAIFNPAVISSFKGDLHKKLLNKVVVMTVANVNPIKGLKCLIKTAAEVNKFHKNNVFVVVGAIYENQKKHHRHLLKLAKKLSVENIIFVGAQSNVKELLHLSDIYLCTSLAESSPIAVWEAMAMGKPIVSTDVGDVPVYVQNGVSGYIEDVNDHFALANRLSKYICNPRLRKAHGDNARFVAIEKLDLALCAERHLSIYLSPELCHPSLLLNIRS